MAASRIDTHHHAIPDFYRDWLTGLGVDAGGMPIPQWTPSASRKSMRRTGVSTAVLSVPTPQVVPGSRGDARLVARDLNEYLHRLVVAEPGTFGYFATLPLPDLEGALAELNYAYDHLTPDGVCLLTNTDGLYLGDPALEPLMAELHRRSAVVFVHPAPLPGPALPGIAPSVADYLLDTVRAALNLARNGVLSRYPGVRFVLSHAGGFVPFAAGRLGSAASPHGNVMDGLRLLRRFWFDTAFAGTPWAMPSLLKFAAKGHVTYGSDFPFAPRVASLASAGYLRLPRRWSGGRALAFENAQRLFPRLVPVVPPIVLPDAPAAILDAGRVEIVNPGRVELLPGVGD